MYGEKGEMVLTEKMQDNIFKKLSFEEFLGEKLGVALGELNAGALLKNLRPMMPNELLKSQHAITSVPVAAGVGDVNLDVRFNVEGSLDKNAADFAVKKFKEEIYKLSTTIKSKTK